MSSQNSLGDSFIYQRCETCSSPTDRAPRLDERQASLPERLRFGIVRSSFRPRMGNGASTPSKSAKAAAVTSPAPVVATIEPPTKSDAPPSSEAREPTTASPTTDTPAAIATPTKPEVPAEKPVAPAVAVASPTVPTSGATTVRLRVCQYNVLSPTYATKWGEREGCVDYTLEPKDRVSNWETRWPAVQRVIAATNADIITLQELEEGEVLEAIEPYLKSIGLELQFWQHPGRVDGVGIAFRTAPPADGDGVLFSRTAKPQSIVRGPVVTGALELTHVESGLKFRVLSSHCRGQDPAQLKALVEAACTFTSIQPVNLDDTPMELPADAEPAAEPETFTAEPELSTPDVILLTADFNEVFACAYRIVEQTLVIA